MKNETSQLIRVLILSHNHITRSGLRRILESHSGFQVLGEGSVRNKAIVESLVRQHPEIILLDLESNDIDALDFLRNLGKLTRTSPVLVLCDLGHDELTRNALSLGAAGIVLKMQPPSVLIAVIQSLCGHDSHDSEMRSQGKEVVATAKSEAADNGSQAKDRINSLTEREREIISHIAAGLKNKEVASQLHISHITVRHHLTSIFSKLDVSDRQKLLILAHGYGLARLALITEPS